MIIITVHNSYYELIIDIKLSLKSLRKITAKMYNDVLCFEINIEIEIEHGNKSNYWITDDDYILTDKSKPRESKYE